MRPTGNGRREWKVFGSSGNQLEVTERKENKNWKQQKTTEDNMNEANGKCQALSVPPLGQVYQQGVSQASFFTWF